MDSLHTDVQVLGDQQKIIDNSSVRTQDAVYKTCRKWWMIGTNGERESGKSMLAAWHNDIHIYIYIYIRGSFNKFPDFFSYGTFIDSTHMKI